MTRHTSCRSRGIRWSTLAALCAGALLVAPAAGAQSGAEQIVNGSFTTGMAPWWNTGNLAPSTAGGRLCVNVPGPTTNPWDAIIGQDGINIVAGVTYEFSFVSSSAPRDVTVRALVQNPVTFATFVDRNPALTGSDRTFTYTFTAASSLPQAQVAFQIGGASAPWTFCLDDVSLRGGAEPEPYVPDTGPRVRVNQVGYLPFGPKAATLVTDRTGPVRWQLRDAAGKIVKQSTTDPAGVDPTSGLNVHRIAFGSVHRPGAGFTITADGETSHPFDISADAYERLRVDALSFYYPQRSGIAIDGAIAGPGYARAAGHVGVAPNRGDLAVPCQPAAVSLPIYGEPWTCGYTLDVRGGWYDAGDHGKYVVNGGISVAQLLGTYERALGARHADAAALGDGTLRVPERGNGVPDVLDEARWELEWMLRMQVPAGQPLAGMAHHKVHDSAWTGLPLAPAADPMLRELHRPSTAATLNLAAAAAQGARLYARYDPAFAARLLAAARTAWTAALANPSLFAPAADGNSGGGPYDDAMVADEFYWAAAELFITTGEPAFRQAVVSSPLHTADVFTLDGFDWGHVGALARLDLATVGNRLPGSDLRRVQGSVLDAADALLALQAAQPWGQPYAPADNRWAWGSTSQILNNLVVLGTAFDLSGKPRYRDAVIEGMDFLLGRNALNISFVTGYGDVFSENQHSRMYAHQLNADLPHPPVGAIAGGPNSGIQDPVAQELLRGCKPQFCYVDDINSWSTNEITVNWNAPLAWVASFVADQDEGGR